MSDLAKVAGRRLKSLQKRRADARVIETLADVFRICSPNLQSPAHLGPYVRALEAAARGQAQELLFHAPPRHGKTEATKHALILAAIVRPGHKHVYATYNAERALVVMKEVTRLAAEAGLDPKTSHGNLYLKGGTSIRFVGRDTALTGFGASGLIVVDDILKGKAEALSLTTRETCWTWFVSDVLTRRETGSSVIVMNTRWHLDDLIGRLIQGWQWPYVRLAAECDSDDDPLGRERGELLWPAMRDQESFTIHRKSENNWASMFQGRPRPVGDALFQDAHYYDALPGHKGFRVLYGVDLAYTTKTRSDWSVLIRARMYGDVVYITDIMRAQVQADVFTTRMAARVANEPGPVLWYGNTIEKGMAPLISQQIRSFHCVQIKGGDDKYARALPTAEQLWNHGKILVKRDAPWADDFVQEVCEFTGQGDAHDDQVDALAALGHLALRGGGASNVVDLNRDLRTAMRGGLRAV